MSAAVPQTIHRRGTAPFTISKVNAEKKKKKATKQKCVLFSLTSEIRELAEWQVTFKYAIRCVGCIYVRTIHQRSDGLNNGGESLHWSRVV